MSTAALRFPRPLAVLAVAGLGLLFLSGCSKEAAPQSTDKAATDTPGAATASPKPSPSPSSSAAVPDMESLAVPVTCDELLHATDIAAYNPALIPSQGAAPAGTTAARITAIGGLHCQWTDPGTKKTLDIGVAQLTAAELEGLKNDAASTLTQVPTYTMPPDEGYFGPVELKAGGSIREAQVFIEHYWLAFDAESFPPNEPGDAEQLTTPALTHLRAAKL